MPNYGKVKWSNHLSGRQSQLVPISGGMDAPSIGMSAGPVEDRQVLVRKLNLEEIKRKRKHYVSIVKKNRSLDKNMRSYHLCTNY